MIARAWAWIDAFFNPPPIRRGVPGWREDRLERFWICGEDNDRLARALERELHHDD